MKMDREVDSLCEMNEERLVSKFWPIKLELSLKDCRLFVAQWSVVDRFAIRFISYSMFVSIIIRYQS